MTKHEKEQAIKAFWEVNQGLRKATEGARMISAQHDLSTNTIRGIQNRLWPDKARKPWNLPPKGDALQICPRCNVTRASDHAELVRLFGVRRVRRGPAHTPRVEIRYQSFCRACKVARRREQRAKFRALLE